ncbi:MAG: S-layer homology domain-containing protein [Oscillospiraceae bacterium]|nr:S-layer homology domain-containing protein [Oscillospiraceae bacterium]
MKKRILSIVLCLVMVFSLLPFTASAASAIPINEETFPDPVFREYVLKIVGSSVLTEEKARQIEVLDVSDDNIQEVLGDRAPITSLMGIRYLRYVKDLNCSGQELKKTLNLEQNSRVEKLNCSGNQLTDLWFHTGSSLRYLDCSVNQFTALNLSKNPELTELYCSSNKLTALDLSANTKLQKIVAQTNALTTLDTRNLPELTHLYLWGNHDLKSIDVSKNTKLEILSACHGKLTSLNVSNNRKLVELYVYNNQLTALDVRSNYMLKKLGCYENQLTALDLSSNVALEYLGVNDNPITELNLHPLSNLQELSCYKMKLTKLDVSRCTELRRLYCNDNQIETLDLRSNKKLRVLECQNNRLSWLDLSSNTALDPRYVDCSGNVYDIKVDENLQYKVYPDLPCYGATEGTYFTAARASDWTGGTVSKVDGWDVLTLDNRDVKEVTYKYDTGNAKIGKVAFTLKTEVPAKYITISFDPNGGTGTMKPMRVKAGVGYTLPECTFTPPEGKEFAGWLAVNGNVYPAGHDVFSTYDQSLKATWKDKEAAEVTISFDPNGGTGTMQPMKVKAGVDFTLPECTFTPPAGKEFAGWLAVNGKVHPAGEVVTSSIDQSFKATWKDKAEVDVTEMFSDVTKNWAYPGIQYCVTHKLMSGTGGDKFAPTMTTTRAQIVQILYNLEGEPKVSGTTPFTDLTQDWYQDAVLWAYQTGVVAGTSSTTFEPDLPVTREQIAVILMEYMTRVLKLERTWTPADLSGFPDAASVSGWAKDALADAVALGLISGASNGGQTYLEPQGSATREQVATILMEFCKNVKK